MAFLAPEPLPLGLLHSTRLRHSWRPAQVDGALKTLTERSLIQSLKQREIGSEGYVVHRIVAALVRMEARRVGRVGEAIASAVAGLNISVPARSLLRQTAGRQKMFVLASHVDAVANYVAEGRVLCELEVRSRAAEACSLLGLYRRTLSEWAAAQEAHRRAVELSDPSEEPGNAALRKVRLAK